MRIRCPHCRYAVEVVEDSSFREVECPSCGSEFNLVGGSETTDTYRAQARTLGHFELIEPLGRGSFGSVWKAKDTKLDRTVAVKIPRKDQLSETEAELFLRDARAAAQLRHPNVVGVHEVGKEDDTIYIAMDYVEGADLSEWLRGEPLPPREVAELMIELASAVQHAHEKGVIHRDLKPGNIMMDRQGRPHIMDFGLAKRERGEITMTIDGATLGTPAYMSPEQASGKSHEADGRSDVYSLGVIFFEMLTGTRPFHGAKRMLIVQILEDDPPLPRKLNHQLPKDLETICLKCLRKEPERRYSSATELANDLCRWRDNEPIRARRLGVIERTWLWCRKRPAVASMAVTVVLTITAALIAISAQWMQNRRNRARSLVDAVVSAQPEAVPFILDELRRRRRDAMAYLQRKLVDKNLSRSQRLHVAFALADSGELPVDLLVDAIPDANPAECQNIATALAHNKIRALQALTEAARRAKSNQEWRHLARLAMVGLSLDDSTLSLDMCQWRPDSIQSTYFIDESSTWHGDLESLARNAVGVNEDSFRYAICLAVGRIPTDRLRSETKRVWHPILLDWSHNAPDSAVRSAAEWTLRRWRLHSSALPASLDVADSREWHVNSIGMIMIKIPAGSFQRQRNPEAERSGKQRISLTRSFLMADREISRKHFQEFVNDRDYPANKKPKLWTGSNPIYSPSAEHPVQNINWHDAILFCNWLSHREDLIACYVRAEGDDSHELRWRHIVDANGYRLPTEAEWEFACRAGAITSFSYGDDESFLADYASFGASRTAICGSVMPNRWGLFDMHGNVWEWCQDWYGAYPEATSVEDPAGSDVGSTRVMRGGSFNGGARYVLASARSFYNPSLRDYTSGLRVVRSPTNDG